MLYSNDHELNLLCHGVCHNESNGLPCDGQAPLDACLYMEGTQQSSTHKLLHSVTLYFSHSTECQLQQFASQLTPCTLLIVYTYKHPLRMHTDLQALRLFL